MPQDFELKTRSQFFSIIEKRDRWLLIRNQAAALERFEQLLGPEWALDNFALDECASSAAWQRDLLDVRRVELLNHHQLAARRLQQWSQSRDFLSMDDLLGLHHILLTGKASGASRFRNYDIESIAEGHEPLEAIFVPDSVENALEWFRAESFQQMHEVEKAALVLAKLVDIHPFEEASGKTIRLFSNFHLLKAGYPPAIISASKSNEYTLALQSALRFHTQPIIDLLTEAMHQALVYCLDEPPPPPALKVLS